MKRFYLITLSLLFTVSGFSFASGKSDNNSPSKKSSSKNVSAAPDWVLDKNTEFPESDFLAQVSEGSSKADAEGKALSYLASYIKSTVNAQRKSESTMTESGTDRKEYTSEKKFENTVNIESEIELFGVDYKYYFSEKENLYYAVAFMNRETTWKIIEGDLEKCLTDSKNNYKNAENATDSFTKIRLHAKNKYVLEEFYKKYYFARVIDYEKAKKYTEIEKTAADSEKRILDIKKSASIQLEFSNPESKKLDKKIREVFEKEGFIVTSEKAVYHCAVDTELKISQNGEWFVSYPKISLEVFDYSKLTVFSFAQVSSRIVGIDKKQAETKSLKKLELMIEDCFR